MRRYYRAPIIAQHRFATGRRSRRICLFAHYHAKGLVTPRHRYYLEALRAAGLETVFITTSPVCPNESLQQLDGLVREAIHRHNWGMDFGSWQLTLLDAFANGDGLEAVDELTLANDSVLGPLWPLSELYDAMASKHADIWGVTDSWEVRYHLQSYFLVFRGHILRSEFFRQFWQMPIERPDRQSIIDRYELTLTERAREAGFRTAAFCGFESLLEAARESRSPAPSAEARALAGPNPTHAYFDLLMEQRRSPFVKMDLLRFNPQGVRWVSRFQDLAPRLVPEPLRRALAVELALRLD
jgi:lipopolysaccharide biosynthesis protein